MATGQRESIQDGIGGRGRIFSTWDEEAIAEQLGNQRTKILKLKEEGKTHLPHMFVVVYDLSDNPVLHSSGRSLLNGLATRGRHSYIYLLV